MSELSVIKALRFIRAIKAFKTVDIFKLLLLPFQDLTQYMNPHDTLRMSSLSRAERSPASEPHQPVESSLKGRKRPIRMFDIGIFQKSLTRLLLLT